MTRGARVTAALAVAVLAATVLAACGRGASRDSGKIAGRTLSIYVSVPLEGASGVSGQAVANAARLALQDVGGHVGRLHIELKVLDDSTPARLEWDPGQTSNNARQASVDPTTVGYIGDLNSGATAVAIPLLNRFGIPQISPTSTAVGLTSETPGAAPGEPFKYYPTGVRTFARVVPNDAVQAAVQVQLQQRGGCTRTFVVDDGEVDGEDFATSFALAARAGGLQVIATQQFDQSATNYSALAASVASTGANCVLIAAITDAHAVLVTKQLAAAVPGLRIFVAAGMAESTYANPALGGIPLALDPRVIITSPALGASAYPKSGQAMLAAYARSYGPPQPSAILGYEATSLMLSAIARATDHGKRDAERSAVLKAIFKTRSRRSVLGTYSIDSGGDTSSTVYGVWTIVDGELRFWKALAG